MKQLHKMRNSELCFKAFWTGVVLVIALSILGWIGLSEIWPFVAILGTLTGILLVIGIILLIWEE